MELGAEGRCVGTLGPEKLERLGVHKKPALALSTSRGSSALDPAKGLGKRSTSDVPTIINDRGWHYMGVVLYHLYNKYAWLPTRKPPLVNIVTG